LVQHRVAWLEQLVLRIADIPYVVVNSPYASMEATGPLPYLKDFSSSKQPVLVGRYHPNGPRRAETTSIIDYLQTERGLDLYKELVTTPEQKSQYHMIKTLVEQQLNPVLAFLRYGDDDAWRQVYRLQYMEAAAGPGYNLYRPHLFAWFQAWSIRTLALKQVGRSWSVPDAVTIARRGYDSLETLLLSDGGRDYILNTSTPSMADVLVWAHLAEALCDVHLVMVLADFPKLVDLFQRMYDAYFRLSPNESEDWRLWNRHENAKNPFQKIPIDTSMPNKKPSHFHDALELMQSLSVHTRDLREALFVSKEKRLLEESYQKPRTPKEQTALYRWRMGGDVFPPKAEDEPQETPQQAKYRKDAKTNDELWISGVFAGVVLVLAFARKAS
jgi:hypothetical protein